MISVIVLTYNQEDTITRTLDSVLMQECDEPMEIVIGEDCSTDNTRAICEEYARRYPDKIRLMPKAPNKGVVDNYFDCLLACRGEYIADCAGDDFWIDRHKLQKETDVLRKDKSVTLVHTDWMNYDERTGDTRPCPPRPFNSPITDGKTMLEAIVTQTSLPVIHLCTALYRKDVLMKAYDEDTFLFRNKDFGCEDLQVCFALAKAGNIAFINDHTLNYGIGRQSVSSNNDTEKQFGFVKRVTELSFYLSEKYNIKSDKTDEYFKARVFALLMHAFRARSKALRKEALRCRKRWGVKPSLMIATATVVTSNDVTWSAALCIRKYFLKFKSDGAR